MATPIQEERFEYKRFPCVVLFQSMGFRTGYVGLPKGHKYYGKEFDFIPVSCHCGLTYANEHLHHQTDTDIWWIGFDCGHCCDGFDTEKLEEYYSNNSEVLQSMKFLRDYHNSVNAEHEFRTLDYVKNECMKIVDQLLAESEE